jgi:hypothetical protein
MSALNLFALLRRRIDDRGAVATMVGILFGGGVLLGMTALTVDVGQLYVEREELQSGADSAAAAIAKLCAAEPTQCTQSAAMAVAARFADSNAKDGASGVLAICGSGGSLQSCAVPLRGNLTDCFEEIPDGADYVEVHTKTREANGSSLLPPSFARALLGNESFAGTEVLACARSLWGKPTNGTSTALTLPDCAYEESVGPSGTGQKVVAIPYRHVQDSYNCHQGGNGFGFIDNPGDCLAQVTTGGTVLDADYNGKGGSFAKAAKTCEEAFHNAYTSGKPVPVSLHGTFEWTSKKWYNVTGMAGFVITGYEGIPGVPMNHQPGDCDCTDPSQGCVYGYFVTDAVPVTASQLEGKN